MKLARLVDPNFHSALEKLSTQNLPIKVAFRLKGIVKQTREEYAKYEEVRKEALQKYGKKDADGNLVLDDKQNVQFEQPDLIAFAKELNDLANEELDMPSISLSELGDNVSLSMNDIENLEGLIIE